MPLMIAVQLELIPDLAKDHVNGDESHKEEADETAESGGKKGEPTENGDAMDVDKKDVEPTTDNNTNALDKVKADDGDAGTTHKVHLLNPGDQARECADTLGETTEANKTADNDVKADAVEEHKQREQAMPSNILEKGIIYFFTRDRVGIDGADSVQDLARTYCVMRPLPDGAKITDGAMPDLKNNRLIALPKKVWPKSGKDRFMAFVEQAQVSNQTLKEKFYSGSDYTTKTTGTRHTPEVTPLGEGVYAMTTTGGGQGTTHLVYMLTIPEEIGEVQKDVGLADKGSFVVSLKNPKSSGPSYAQLPQKPDFPDEVFEEFRGRGWMPAHPKHLDYANAQMLLIGENFESSDNLEAAAKDAKDDSKETPQEELEKLEHEDELRVERLKGMMHPRVPWCKSGKC